jgi:hypothetical protein
MLNSICSVLLTPGSDVSATATNLILILKIPKKLKFLYVCEFYFKMHRNSRYRNTCYITDCSFLKMFFFMKFRFFSTNLNFYSKFCVPGPEFRPVCNIDSCRCHQAMTGGIVGGLARVYLPFTWGIPFIVFGYDLAANIQATTTF